LDSAPRRTMTAVLAAHLGDRQSEYVRDYARHSASMRGRVGLIEADAHELKITCFDPAPTQQEGEPAEPAAIGDLDSRRMAEVLEELAWDIDHWLLSIPTPRNSEPRNLLSRLGQWTLLSTCDHDGVIASYRSIKGLADGTQPRISLALLDAA